MKKREPTFFLAVTFCVSLFKVTHCSQCDLMETSLAEQVKSQSQRVKGWTPGPPAHGAASPRGPAWPGTPRLLPQTMD